eukprot:389883-Amphidinium_carterae.1
MKHPSSEKGNDECIIASHFLLLGVSWDGILNVHCAQTASPENKATVLLITHRQRTDTCRNPGTDFTMEYQMPGTNVRTLVVQA